ncbi:hypothetical protein FACS1894219_09340 [Clostridia bacterium]|nr:hypothetical protein FACS1894219_09340 [Clostridia bacterium]
MVVGGFNLHVDSAASVRCLFVVSLWCDCDHFTDRFIADNASNKAFGGKPGVIYIEKDRADDWIGEWLNRL